jgi:hypothetical protein
MIGIRRIIEQNKSDDQESLVKMSNNSGVICQVARLMIYTLRRWLQKRKIDETASLGIQTRSVNGTVP